MDRDGTPPLPGSGRGLLPHWPDPVAGTLGRDSLPLLLLHWRLFLWRIRRVSWVRRKQKIVTVSPMVHCTMWRESCLIRRTRGKYVPQKNWEKYGTISVILENFPGDPPDIDSVVSSFSLLFVQESLHVTESGKRNYQGCIRCSVPNVSACLPSYFPSFLAKLFCHLPFAYCNRAFYSTHCWDKRAIIHSNLHVLPLHMHGSEH